MWLVVVEAPIALVLLACRTFAELDGTIAATICCCSMSNPPHKDVGPLAAALPLSTNRRLIGGDAGFAALLLAQMLMAQKHGSRCLGTLGYWTSGGGGGWQRAHLALHNPSCARGGRGSFSSNLQPKGVILM